MLDVTFFAYPTEIVWWQLALYGLAVAWGSFVVGCFGVGGGAVRMPLLLMLPGLTPSVAAGSIFVGSWPTALCRALQLLYFGRLAVRKSLPLMTGALAGALLGQVALPYLPGDAVALLVAGLAAWTGLQTHRSVMKEISDKKAAQQAALALSVLPDPSQECKAADPESGEGLALDNITLEEVIGARIIASQQGPRDLADAILAEAGAGAEAGDSSPSASLEGEAQGLRRSVIFSLDKPTNSALEFRLQVLFKVALGLGASFFSSVSGTGGPLILFPLALLLNPQAKAKEVVSMSAPFASTLSAFSALGAVLFGKVDLGLSVLIAVVGTVFSLLGGICMERMGDTKLKAGVGICLMLVGFSVGARTSFELFF